MDISTKESDNLELEGKRPGAVANTMAKIYAEYSLPAINGLVLTGGLYHTGSAHWDQAYDYKIKAYTLVNIGMRYSTNMADTPVTFRLAVINIANKDYWLNKFHLGTPKTVSFSMSTKF